MSDYDQRRRGIERLPLPAEDREFLLDVLCQYEIEMAEWSRGEVKPDTDDAEPEPPASP